MMKKITGMIIVFLLALTVLFAHAEQARTEQACTDVAVLSTTDMHGKCWETNLLTQSAESNNMLRVSTAVNRFRSEYGAENVVLIDNGDLFQGTPFSEVQLTKYLLGISDLPPAMALCLTKIGYDAFILGNHEFGFDWAGMTRVYDFLEAGGVPVLAANICYDGTDGVHEAGENAFTPYIVKTIVVNGHEHKIGILGLDNTDISLWEMPVNYPGLRFVSPGNDNWEISVEAGKFLGRMKAEGCEFIIVSYHGALGTADTEITSGENSEHQGLRLIRETDDIAMLILGHDHSTGYSNTYEMNSAGEPVLIVNGGGQNMTKSVFRFSEDASGALVWTIVGTENVDLGNYEADETLQAALQPYADITEAEVNLPVGQAAGDWDLSDAYYTEQTDTIDLINAAQKAITTQLIEQKYGQTVPEELSRKGLDHLDVDLSMTNVVTGDKYVVRPGDISFRDLHRLYRYANNLCVLPMTGAQIKAVMEEIASNRLTVRVHDGEAFFYTWGDRFTNILFGGLNFTYDMSRPAGERVEITGFSNGRAFDGDQLYLAVVSSFLLGNKTCGLRDFSEADVIWSQLTDTKEVTIHDILMEYIRQRTLENGAVTPEDFNWHWEIVYGADLSEQPAFEGIVGATLAARPEDGRSYVIYSEAYELMLTGRSTENEIDAVACPAEGAVLPGPLPADAEVFTAHAAADGSFQFTSSSGLYLVSGKNGGLTLRELPEDESLSRWFLEPANGGWYIVSAGAARHQAIQYDSERFSLYELNYTGNFIFHFYQVQ